MDVFLSDGSIYALVTVINILSSTSFFPCLSSFFLLWAPSKNNGSQGS